ncbi:MAG: hypothetical protein LBT14_07705 [Treponema sp.]|nr:hypothetical protein [Treponema sp.]
MYDYLEPNQVYCGRSENLKRQIKPGGFMVINIADILAFKDSTMPRIQGLNASNRKCSVTREMVLQAKAQFPYYNRD